MSCVFDQRVLIANRIAQVVPAATPGASNSLTEQAVLTLPSPRLQALVSVLMPPSAGLGQTDVLWMDASNAAALSVAAATWQIFPLPEISPDILTPNATLARLWQTCLGRNVIPSDAIGGMAYMADYHSANAYGYVPTYELAGETCRRWFIWANLSVFNDPAVPVYAAMQAEITPAPGVRMDDAEWKHWLRLCTLQSLTSSSARPPLLKKANG